MVTVPPEDLLGSVMPDSFRHKAADQLVSSRRRSSRSMLCAVAPSSLSRELRHLKWDIHYLPWIIGFLSASLCGRWSNMPETQFHLVCSTGQMDNLSRRPSIRQPCEEQSNFFNKGRCVPVWQPVIPQFSRSKHGEKLTQSSPEHVAICNFQLSAERQFKSLFLLWMTTFRLQSLHFALLRLCLCAWVCAWDSERWFIMRMLN